jgi:hypothetical protein
MRLAAHKLPIATKFVTRQDQEAGHAALASVVGVGTGKTATDEPEQVTGRLGETAQPDAPEQAVQVPARETTVEVTEEAE